MIGKKLSGGKEDRMQALRARIVESFPHRLDGGKGFGVLKRSRALGRGSWRPRVVQSPNGVLPVVVQDSDHLINNL